MAQNLVSNNPQVKNVNIMSKKLATCASALNDFEHIYSDKFLTDVELKTKTNSFPAHKIVLCARSPVFRLMFSNDMREKNSDSIQVDDLEDETVQQLLLFLYSDKVEDLQWETATKLYYAADKYEIEKLKLICSSFLIDNLSTFTATELLVLADTHSDSDFQRVVVDFILDHEELVFCSDKWEKLMEENPQLALKIMHSKYKTKKKHLSESDISQGNEMVLRVEMDEGPKNCFLCPRLFSNQELYERHLVHFHMIWVKEEELNHNDGTSPSDAIRSYQKVAVPTEKELIDISHPIETVFYCTICGREYLKTTYQWFYLHMLYHGNEKCFQCIVKSCLKTFTSPSMFEQHIQKHPQVRMYSCKPCGIDINSADMVKHLRTCHLKKL